MMMGSMGIAAETKKRDVDGRVPLEFYSRTANNLLAQVPIIFFSIVTSFTAKAGSALSVKSEDSIN